MQEVVSAVTEVHTAQREAGMKGEETGPPHGDRILAVIGYISYFCILPLCLRQESHFCKFHGKQGLILTLFFLPLYWISGVWEGLMSDLFPVFSTWFYLALGLVHIAMAVMGMKSAAAGTKVGLPVFGTFARSLDF